MSENLEAKLEALLFVYGEPVRTKTLADKLGVKEEAVKDSLNQLRTELESEKRGLSLVFAEDRVQLTTKPSLSDLMEKIIKEEFDTDLTAASLETLSIIAYLGPCNRAEIDYIRGVNSSFILRNLTVRGLVERKLDPHRSNAFIYNVSFDFLKHMGLGGTEDLPEYEKYRELVKSYLRKENELEVKS